MGHAANLFFSTTEPENCLDYRVRPSEEQYETQKERWNNLADHLKKDLAERSGCTIATWLQGSYKFGTQVRPANTDSEFDIDLGVYFIWKGNSEDGEYSPLEVKRLVNASLFDYVEDEGNDAGYVSLPKTRCERIHFSEDFHIDVPSYHLDQENDVRSLATEPNEWEESDPKAIYVWWKDEFGVDVRPRVRRMVRYLKMWAALKTEDSARPSSILLTVLVGETYAELEYDGLSGDDEYFREIVSGILNRLRRSKDVKNPVDGRENLNRLPSNASNALIDTLSELLSIADRALASPTKSDAADIWSEAFDHFFPIPSEDEVVAEEATLSKSLVSTRFTPEVAVRASWNGKQITGTNKIGPIPKGCKLEFALLNSVNLPDGATVNWMVRNSGHEAETENDLGHSQQDMLNVEESSAYQGEHYMDVTVRLNGRIIGRRRVPVLISSFGYPARNPQRPAWNRLRGRRR